MVVAMGLLEDTFTSTHRPATITVKVVLAPVHIELLSPALSHMAHAVNVDFLAMIFHIARNTANAHNVRDANVSRSGH